jgi:hypothetical protein
MRCSNPDHICGLCDEFDVDQAAPECAEKGMGLCLVAEQGKPFVHVSWDSRPCVSFRLERVNLAKRRQEVELQRRQLPTQAQEAGQLSCNLKTYFFAT